MGLLLAPIPAQVANMPPMPPVGRPVAVGTTDTGPLTAVADAVDKVLVSDKLSQGVLVKDQNFKISNPMMRAAHHDARMMRGDGLGAMRGAHHAHHARTMMRAAHHDARMMRTMMRA